MENAKGRIALRVPAKASLWYVASSAVARAIGALGTPIFTRLLTPEEYGLYPLYNTWLGVLTVIITLELTGTVMYRGLQRHREDTDSFIGAVLGLILTLSVIFLVIYALLGGFINRLTGLGTPEMLLMLVQIVSTSVISLYTARARFEYRYKAVAFLNLLTAVASPMLAVLFIASGIRAESRIIGSALALALTALPILIVTVRHCGALYSRNTWRYLLGKSLPLMPHYFAMTMILKVGEIAVSRIHGQEALGRFSVAMSVGMSLTVVTGGVMSALSPWMLRRVGGGDIGRIRELLFLLTELISLSCLGLFAIAPEALALLASPAYRSALPAVYPLALSVIPTFLSGALMSGAAYFERSGISALPAVCAACLSAILSLLLLPFVDYRYLSLTVLACYTLLAALNVLTFTKMAGSAPIYVRKTLLVFLGTCGYAALLFAIRDVMLSRLILAVPLVPVVFKVGTRAIKEMRE